MFDSKITAAALIDGLRTEADITIPLPDESYISWLNATEGLLYSEIIREQGKLELSGIDKNVIDISDLSVPETEAPIRFEDIHAVYADGVQLVKTSLASGAIFSDSFYKTENNIGLSLKKTPQTIKIIYFVRPAPKTAENMDAQTVKVPAEFTDLVKAKLRGEAYKIANEDGLAAKWINDYNVLVDSFKVWIQARQTGIGI